MKSPQTKEGPGMVTKPPMPIQHARAACLGTQAASSSLESPPNASPVLSLSQLPLPPLHSALTDPGPPVSTRPSQGLPKALGPLAPCRVLSPGLSLKGKQVELRVVFRGRSDGKARGQDPATAKSGWVPKIQGVMPWAREACPPVQRSSPNAGQPRAPPRVSRVTPVGRAPASGTPGPCPSTPLPPRGLPGREPPHQRPTPSPTAAPRFPSPPASP